MIDQLSYIDNIDPVIIGQLHPDFAWEYRVVPYDLKDHSIFLFAEENTTGRYPVNEIELLTGKNAVITKLSSNFIEDLLQRFYKRTTDARQQSAYYSDDADKFLSHLITEAKSLHSSDIHIEIFEEKCRVRIRIDGMLIQRYMLDKKQYPSLINKIKITANLDIAEKRLPQDGRILFEENKQQKFDIRVSSLPTLYGEKIVLRLLNNNATDIEIAKLGLSNDDLWGYMEGIRKPNGILLISGPTGSGKTTTLYATLKELNKDTRNILTIEDPIEYTLEGINQVQLREDLGLTFSSALRTFLRQDPDVIMLGEIRDAETANMSIRAALTGHLVLSTIHTNSAWGIVSRLIDMGVEPHLLSNTLNTAVAQRLLRLLCPHCKEEVKLNEKLYPRSFIPYAKLDSHYIAKGCNICHNTGYKGRKAVYEVIPVDEELSDYIKNSNFRIHDVLQQKKIKSLSQNGFDLFEKGLTSLDEIYSLLMN